MFSLYILECADGTLYVGHTDNLDERMRQHDAGKADAYTAKRHPLKLLHVEEFETRYEALVMERKLKGWSRAKKLAYIAGDWNTVGVLSKGKHRHQRVGRFDFVSVRPERSGEAAKSKGRTETTLSANGEEGAPQTSVARNS